MPLRPSRRRFLAASGAALLAPPIAVRAHGLAAPTAQAHPFTLGVASGSPVADGFVIWTRLAPDPLAPDGRGGVSGEVPVAWEIAADEGLRNPVLSGRAVADPRLGHSVHVEVGGLQPGRPYWYRFTAQGHQSPVGRARTTPAPGARLERLRFAFASCANWETGWYGAYRHMAAEDPDVVLFLGDYIYEYSHTGEKAKSLVRRHDQEGDIVSLADYRNRYALYRTDPDLRGLHAAAPCLVTWDDHEVHNDYANRWSMHPQVSQADFLKRRAAAYQAFYEHMPLRPSARPQGGHARIYGQAAFGDLATFTVLDGRQYRTIQPCATSTSRRGHVAPQACRDLADPQRTMLGWAQERWLYDRFSRGPARWTVVAQDLLVAQLEQTGSNGVVGHYTDGWDGYQANRKRMLDALVRSEARNPVFLAGDVHAFFANDLKADFGDPASRTIATEFVGTSITSDNPPAAAFADARWRNPHVRFLDDRTNGYVCVDVTPQQMMTRFRAISDRRDRVATVSTLQSFVVEDGRPGAVAG